MIFLFDPFVASSSLSNERDHFMQLREIDRLEIMVLMDNLSDPFTVSHKNLRWNEFQYLMLKLNL